jgi:dGTPase
MSQPDEAAFVPPDFSEWEEKALAPYAMRTRHSQGRRYPEPPHAYRTAYQRDRDRIVHSTAFRRLMYKTQVLVSHTNDHHRTRLTHTIEVSQISRTIARCLGLNEDLTEAIALAHDLGHPPFGHAGEAALNECMSGHGGFEHNAHALRIVDVLEYRYPAFPGLNLTFEVLEAQALHSKRPDAPEVRPYRDAGQPLLEAQVVDAADSLAYNAHDVDDALGYGLIDLDDLRKIEFWRRAEERARQQYPGLGGLQLQPTVVRALIDWQVRDLLDHTHRQIARGNIRSIEEVRRARDLIVGLSPAVAALRVELEEFLFRSVYRHSRVMRMAVKGRRILRALFSEFCTTPEQLPDRYCQRARSAGLERTVCDYLAGMTDRYAQNEYLQLGYPDVS